MALVFSKIFSKARRRDVEMSGTNFGFPNKYYSDNENENRQAN